MVARISLNQQRINEFCRRHHLRRLALFGSVLCDDFNPDSDVDILYEFEPGHSPGWDIVSIVEELEEIVGRPVDFVPRKYLNQSIRDQILSSAQVLYDGSD